MEFIFTMFLSVLQGIGFGLGICLVFSLVFITAIKWLEKKVNQSPLSPVPSRYLSILRFFLQKRK